MDSSPFGSKSQSANYLKYLAMRGSRSSEERSVNRVKKSSPEIISPEPNFTYSRKKLKKASSPIAARNKAIHCRLPGLHPAKAPALGHCPLGQTTSCARFRGRSRPSDN